MTKKLFILVTFIMLALTSAHAQREVYYRCTGNNVNVRKGPGVKYGKVMSVGGAKCPMGAMQLFKGNIVVGNGVKRNGFIHINYALPYPCIEDGGWVSAQYLVPAKRCASCKGKGVTGRTCPECNGEGYGYCCNNTGKELCPRCAGVGYH